MKSSAFTYPDEVGFHRVAISSTAGGFLPPSADLVKKALAFASAFLARVDRKDAYLFKVLFAFICFSFCYTLFPKIRLGDIYFVQLFIRRNGSVTTTTVL